jgi:hypothetical protein
VNRTLSLLLSAILVAPPFVQAQKLNPSEKKTLLLSPAAVLIGVTYTLTATLEFGKTPSKKDFTYTEFGTEFLHRPDGYLLTNGHIVQHANSKDKHAQDHLNSIIINDVLRPLISKLFPAASRNRNGPLPSASSRNCCAKSRSRTPGPT